MDVAYQRRDIKRCFELATRYLELAIKLGDRPGEAHAHDRLGDRAHRRGLAVRAGARALRGRRPHLRRDGERTGRAGLLLNQALLETRLGFFDRAAAATEKAVELFESANDERGRVGGLNNLIFLRACTGDIAGAREAGEFGARDRAPSSATGCWKRRCSRTSAMPRPPAGNYARAIELAEASFELRSRSESQVWSSKTLANLAVWYAALGNLPAARDAVARMVADEDAIMRATDWPSYCYWAAAQIFHLGGDRARHRRCSRRHAGS